MFVNVLEGLSLNYIIAIIVCSGLGVICLGILFYFGLCKFYLNKKKCRKILDELQSKYEYLHALLTGQDNSYIQRLEIISRTNLLYSDIHASYFKRSKEIRETTDQKYQDILFELQNLLDENKTREFKLYYKEKLSILKQYEESVNSLNNDLVEVIRPEEEARQMMLAEKEKFREVKSNFNYSANELNYVSSSFEQVFQKIDRDFNDFEDFIENANYDEAKEMIPRIDKVLDLLDKLIVTIPPLINEVNDIIPAKVKTLKEQYERLLKEGKPLSHLGVENTINEINEALEIERANIKNLAVSKIKEETEQIEALIDELLEKFKVEDASFEEFNEKKEIVISEFLNYDKELVKINNNIARFKKIYIIDDEHLQELDNIRTKVEEVSTSKRKLDQYMRNIEPYPYSELLVKLKELENGTREISNRINAFNDYLISLKNDSETAFKNIKTKYDLLKTSEQVIRELKSDKYIELFKDRFDDCYALIDDISKILGKVPIDVKQANQYQMELNEKTNNLVKEIQELNNFKKLAEEDILLVNRDRMKFAEINNIISQAETLFLSGDFKNAYEMSEQALEKLNFRDKQ